MVNMRTKVPWTKTMLEKFIEEALLTEDEEKILRTRVAGWSIIKQSTELNISESTVSRTVKKLKQKYLTLQQQFPDTFPAIKPSKYDDALNATTLAEDVKCTHLLNDFTTSCGKNMREMSVEEIVECQKNCSYDEFYMIKK